MAARSATAASATASIVSPGRAMPPPSVTPRTTVRPPLGARDGQAEADYLFYRLHDNLDRATARATGWTRIGLAKKTLIMTRKRLCTHVIQLVSRDLADFDMHAQSGVSTYSAQHAQTPSPLTTPSRIPPHGLSPHLLFAASRRKVGFVNSRGWGNVHGTK